MSIQFCVVIATVRMFSAASKLKALKAKYGFSEPDRGNLDDPEIRWREGKPDYTQANCFFLEGKTQNHKQGTQCTRVNFCVKTL